MTTIASRRGAQNRFSFLPWRLRIIIQTRPSTKRQNPCHAVTDFASQISQRCSRYVVRKELSTKYHFSRRRFYLGSAKDSRASRLVWPISEFQQYFRTIHEQVQSLRFQHCERESNTSPQFRTTRGVPTSQDRSARWYDLSRPSLDKRGSLKPHRRKMNNMELPFQPPGLGWQMIPRSQRHTCTPMPMSSQDRRTSL